MTIITRSEFEVGLRWAKANPKEFGDGIRLWLQSLPEGTTIKTVVKPGFMRLRSSSRGVSTEGELIVEKGE